MKVKTRGYRITNVRAVDNLLSKFNWISSLPVFRHKVTVRLDDYDTWDIPSTLGPVIVPLLKQFKETTHGAPFVDDEDVPEHLRSTSAKPKENEWDADEFHFDRWNYVLNEMITAFEYSVEDCHDRHSSGTIDFSFEKQPNGNSLMVHGPNHTYKVDYDAVKAEENRAAQGRYLFAKYYLNLWD